MAKSPTILQDAPVPHGECKGGSKDGVGWMQGVGKTQCGARGMCVGRVRTQVGGRPNLARRKPSAHRVVATGRSRLLWAFVPRCGAVSSHTAPPDRPRDPLLHGRCGKTQQKRQPINFGLQWRPTWEAQLTVFPRSTTPPRRVGVGTSRAISRARPANTQRGEMCIALSFFLVYCSPIKGCQRSPPSPPPPP